MGATLTSQMNIRINASLKERGDAALAQLGYTTTEVVRAIWTLAASGGSGLDILQPVLAQGTIIERENAEGAEAKAQREAALLEGWQLYDYYVAQLPEGVEIVPTTLSDDELLEREMFARMKEKGLI